MYDAQPHCVGTLFASLEVALRDECLLYLLGYRRKEATESLHKRITWGAKQAGIEIPDPTQTANANFKTSEHCCEVLNASLLNGTGITRAS